jgi:His/Glu/Gln/Arg/opine family amino acid ABC transporter permease subunit
MVKQYNRKEALFMDVNPTKDNPRQQIRIQPPAILRNLQVLQTIAQILFVIIFISSLFILWSNISATLAERNLFPSFDFLNNRAGFDISEKPDWYSPSNNYGEAFSVGIMNTLRIVLAGLFLATVIGCLLGIFLLSRNWLIRTISRTYVEIIRNTPLLVQLIFWYFVVMFSLPLDDITLPSEGIFVLPLRMLVYPILLVIAFIAVRRRIAPQRTVEGVFVGAVLVEIAYAILGASTPITIGTAIIGAGLLFFSRNGGISASGRGQLLGMGLAAVGQALVTGIVTILVSSGAIPTSVVWWELLPAVYISRRSFVFPEFATTNTFQTWFIILIVGALIGYAVHRYLSAYAERTGRLIPSGLYGLLILIVIGGVGWVILSSQPEPTDIVFDGETINVAQAREAGEIGFREEVQITTRPVLASMPERGRFRFDIGTLVSPEYIALLMGLVVYTSAFIGEIVRAGIQAVPYGQLEASRAMGLSTSQTLRLVVLPQALRLIVPPLSNQYLNLAKNSSLAIAVAFADTYQVGQTMMNQSGQSVTGFTMILVTYLTMSLFISVVMNIVNSRFQLKTR